MMLEAAGWVVFLPVVVLLSIWNKRIVKGGGGRGGGRSRDIIAVTTLVLAGIAGCGLAFTFLGRWYAAFVSWAASGLASISGQAGLDTAIPITLALGLLATVVFDVARDRVADKGAQYAAMLLPTTVLLIVGGLMHQTGGGAVRTVTGQVASLMMRLGAS